ncbi:MAG: PEP-CTERM sorting domain-containing protein [Pyrinomonadaceae bacterium]
MRQKHSAAVKSATLGVMLFALLVLGQSVAHANEIRLVGGTTGMFDNGSVAFNGLIYRSAGIDGATNGGILVLDGQPAFPNLNNLGSFTIQAAPTEFAGAFTLTVQFDLPAGVVVGNPRAITGSAFFDSASNALLIDMDNTPFLFTFSNDSGFGTFSLALDDLLFFFGTRAPAPLFAAAITQVNTVNCTSFPCTGALTGRIITPAAPAAVPEPATLLLLATGISGLAAGVRRRTKRQNDV